MIAVLAGSVLPVIFAHNLLVLFNVQKGRPGRTIDVQLEGRNKSDPSVVAAVKEYAGRERLTPDVVAAARARAVPVQCPGPGRAARRKGRSLEPCALFAIRSRAATIKASPGSSGGSGFGGGGASGGGFAGGGFAGGGAGGL